jgi:predicted nucleic acid-binding protein
MVLMLDTNVILDHVMRREPHREASRMVCMLGITGEARTLASVSMVTDLFYLLCKDYGSEMAQRMIAEDLSFLEYVGISPDDVETALSRRWKDLEDCLVAVCAEKAGADFIVTRNAADFTNSKIKALSPKELLAWFERSGSSYEALDW